jgi:hypothetical protein
MGSFLFNTKASRLMKKINQAHLNKKAAQGRF